MKEWLTVSQLICEVVASETEGFPLSLPGMKAFLKRTGIDENPKYSQTGKYGNNRTAKLYSRSLILDYARPASGEWISAADLITAALPGIPNTRRSFNWWVMRQGWRADPSLARRSVGMSSGFEYHISLLSPEAKAAWISRSFSLPPKLPNDNPAIQGFYSLVSAAFPDAAKITVDLSRPEGKRIVVTMRAFGRPMTGFVNE